MAATSIDSQGNKGNTPDSVNLSYSELQESVSGIQHKIQDTYSDLEKMEAVGSFEGVKIVLTGVYHLVDIDLQQKAMSGGLKEFKHRLLTAWKMACDKVRSIAQDKTMSLINEMPMPEGFGKLSEEIARKMLQDIDKDKRVSGDK